MLPNDLENLVESIIATNIFSNNILQYITTGDYWNVINEYKPLMHTWSLGIEEQYYLFYPFVFLIIGRWKKKYIFPTLIILTSISLILFLFPSFDDVSKFYLIPFRFFEISLGGIGAIIFKDKVIKYRFSWILIFVILFILCFNVVYIPNNFKLLLIVTMSLGLIISANSQNRVSSIILENKLIVGIGKISFSLYMWHQLIFAYCRYFVLEEINFTSTIILYILIFSLSIVSYNIIEKPFRNKKKISVSILIWLVSIGFVITTGLSFFIYFRAGVIRDIPELDITQSNIQKNIHAQYNDNIYSMNKEFTTSNKIKVLIIGDSQARDWANILLESKFNENIEISYIFSLSNNDNVRNRLDRADYIYFSGLNKQLYDEYAKQYSIDTLKVWCVGIKKFGVCNGIFYNKRGSKDYLYQKTIIKKDISDRNTTLKDQWGNKYIDLIEMNIDQNGFVPVFTPNGKFISPDCVHLSKAGAIYFAGFVEKQIQIN